MLCQDCQFCVKTQTSEPQLACAYWNKFDERNSVDLLDMKDKGVPPWWCPLKRENK